MSIRPRFVLGSALLGIAAIALLVGGALLTHTGRRILLVLLDDTPTPAAATTVRALQPIFDGLDATRPQQPVVLQPLITGVPAPTDVAFVPGHPTRVVVLSKTGTATLASTTDGTLQPWLQLPVATTSELGLLGIAFHPDFEANGRLFVNHTPERPLAAAATVVSELSTDPHTLSAPSHTADLLEVAQPYPNHDGGQLAFGPDGKLYVAFGDGGFRADPLDAGQDRSTLLGSIVRLDVAQPGVASAPHDNPFVDLPGARPEIWAWGLRNPWRFHFDPRGRMVVADVGQSRWDEVSLVQRGDNLGWRLREGSHCFDPATDCPTDGLVDPVYEYGRDDGVSITGGVVWTAPGPLQGRYVFGDFGTGRLWALQLPERRAPTTDVLALGRFPINPAAFARDPDGRVVVADYGSGAIFAIQPN
ncbi:MAG: PQQ-dependent sugar dehydrogenase [Myxococcales bacterium]|nr:PQQ-dependent sugar dehydrogenase [Myxococcales bacterium]